MEDSKQIDNQIYTYGALRIYPYINYN